MFCIRQMLEKELEYSEEVHQLLKGLKKAYDSVGRKVFLILTSSYLSTVCVRGPLLHLITLDDTQSVGLLWTSDQRAAETSTRQH
jgi:hypothetical protein